MPKERSSINDQIFSGVRTLIDTIIFTTGKQSHTFEGVSLHPSEIHLLLHVSSGEEQAKNVTKIAAALGVTKGAVSQNLKRLVNKGLIIKETDGARKNELSVHFTPKGRRVLMGCVALRDQFRRDLGEVISDFTDDQKRAIGSFLERIEKIL